MNDIIGIEEAITLINDTAISKFARNSKFRIHNFDITETLFVSVSRINTIDYLRNDVPCEPGTCLYLQITDSTDYSIWYTLEF